MAFRPSPECGNAVNLKLYNGDRTLSSRIRKRSSFWGIKHNRCSISHSIPFSNRRFNSSTAIVCFGEQQHLPPYTRASVSQNGACSSRQCSLSFFLGVCHDFPVAPLEASSLKTSTRLQRRLITFRSPGRWVCFGGGPRPKRPRVWKTRQRRGSVSKSQKLLDHVRSLSNVKEEVYGALDAFIAWEIEFPLIAVKKALYTLKSERAWKRIIQISKWMIGKGQGKTFGSYVLLLEAFDHEGRIEEAQELWEKVLTKNLGHTPRSFFELMISMFDRHQMYDELLEVFADMEELNVKPSPAIVNKVSLVYEKLGIFDKAGKVKEKYPPPTMRYRTTYGKAIKFPVRSIHQAEKRSFLQDSYGSCVGDETFDSGKEEDFGDNACVQKEVIDRGSSQAVGEEIQFAQSQV